MSEELEQSVSDVSGESSAPAESASLEQGPKDNSDLSSSPQSKPEQEKYVPYDRFKELVEQKNEFSRRQEAYEKQIKEMQDRFESLSRPKEASPEDAIRSRLKGIDPEFAKYIESIEARAAKAEALETRLNQFEGQNTRSQAEASLERLQAEFKVPKHLHDRYRSSIELEAHRNPKLMVSDLPALYKKYQAEDAKYLEEYKRTAIAEYSKSKKTDSTVPSSSKSPAKYTAPSKEANAKLSRDESLAMLKDSVKKELRKAREL